MHYLVCGGGPPFQWEPHAIIHSNKHIWCVVGAPISVGTSCNPKFEHALFGVWWGPHFSGTSCNHKFEHALFGVWWGPRFSGNLLQSYIRTCTIRCVVGAPILVGTSCNHTFEHALFGVWLEPSFQWEPHAIIHSNMHYLVCVGGPHFNGNLMQSCIRTCTIRCLVGAPSVSVEMSCNFIHF